MRGSRRLRAAAFLFAAGASLVVAPAPGHAADQASSEAPSFAPGWHQQGPISYYGRRFDSRPTASGEPFDPDAMTMAHPTLPLGSIVRVKNLRNGRVVELRVNDRGPYEKGRIADVSRAAARELGMLRRGVVRARIELLRVGEEPGPEPER
ncbi:MAG TPA: septal ring lytic transglycosylase RlpA family protein [Zeimonas sp.]